MLEATEKQSYALHCELMASQGIDYLRQFPELNEYRVEAADGQIMPIILRKAITAKFMQRGLFMP